MSEKAASKRVNRTIVATYAVVVAVFVLGAAVPLALACRKARASIAATRVRLRNASNISRQDALCRQRVHSMLQYATRTHQLVPQHLRLGTFLSQLVACQNSSGFHIGTPQSGSRGSVAMCSVLPVSVRGSGTAGSFERFLTALQALPRKCWVRQLSMKASPTMDGHITANFTVEIYALRKR